MLQNIIRNRREKSVTLKIVYGLPEEAECAQEDLEDYKEENANLVKKMQLLYGLKDINLTTVANNLFIVYHFDDKKEAKEFELTFTRNILDDGSNLFESFLISQQEQETKKEEEQFKIMLKLPEKAVKILKENDSLLNVTMLSEPSCPIYADMIFADKKRVKVVDKDFEKPIVNISFRLQGTTITRSVPQKWLSVEEIVYSAVVNTQWALNPKNIISMNNDEVLSVFKDKEIGTPVNIIKEDGKTVKLYKRESSYIDTTNGTEYHAEHLIFN